MKIKLILLFNFFIRPLVYFTPVPNIISLMLIPYLTFRGIIISNKNLYLGIFLYLFLILNLFSCFINNVSILNGLINYMIVCFPFFLKIIIDENNFNFNYYRETENLLIILLLINNTVSIFQFLLLNNQDKVQGLFIGQGMGHHINGALNFFFAIYIISKLNKKFKKTNLFLVLYSFLITFMSDTKSIIFAFLCSIFVYLFLKLILAIIDKNKKIHFQNILTTIFYLIGSIVFTYIFLKFFVNLRHINLDYFLYGFSHKYSLYSQIFPNFFDLLFGYGPGMTTSKLAFMANFFERYDFLENFYYTFSNLSQYIFFDYQYQNYLTNPTTGSSLFQVNFTFGGILGDLGLIGIFLYLILFFMLFKIRLNNFLETIFIIQILFLGLYFTWLEEVFFMVPLIIIFKLLQISLLEEK